MAIIEWKEEFVTGDSVIDSRHRALCKMIADLHDAIILRQSPQVILGCMDGLERYLGHLFQTERQLMESSNFPATRAHSNLHEEIEAKVRETHELVRSGKVELGVSFTQSMARWFSEHLSTDDKRLAQWARLHGGTTAPSGHFSLRDSASSLQASNSVGAGGEPDHPDPNASSGTWTARDSLRMLVASKVKK
jgi:hemerythrin